MQKYQNGFNSSTLLPNGKTRHTSKPSVVDNPQLFLFGDLPFKNCTLTVESCLDCRRCVK